MTVHHTPAQRGIVPTAELQGVISAINASAPAGGEERWVPRRLLLFQSWYYRRQEFWLTTGRLILRGQNGAGKSTVLALALPFGLEGSLQANRFSTFGDRARSAYTVLYPDDETDQEQRPPTRTAYIVWEWEHTGTGERACTVAAIHARRASPGEVKFEGAVLPGTGYGHGSDEFALTPDAESDEAIPLKAFRQAISARGQRAVHCENLKEYKRAINDLLFGFADPETDLVTLFDIWTTLRTPKLGGSKGGGMADNLQRLRDTLPSVDPAAIEPVVAAYESYEKHRRLLTTLRSDAQAMAELATTAVAVSKATVGRAAKLAQTAAVTAADRARALLNARTQADQQVAAALAAETATASAEAAVTRTTAEIDALQRDPRLTDVEFQLAELRAQRDSTAAAAAKSAREASSTEASAERAGEHAETARITREQTVTAVQRMATTLADAEVGRGLASVRTAVEGVRRATAHTGREVLPLLESAHQEVGVHDTRIADAIRARETAEERLMERQRHHRTTSEKVLQATDARERDITVATTEAVPAAAAAMRRLTDRAESHSAAAERLSGVRAVMETAVTSARERNVWRLPTEDAAHPLPAFRRAVQVLQTLVADERAESDELAMTKREEVTATRRRHEDAVQLHHELYSSPPMLEPESNATAKRAATAAQAAIPGSRPLWQCVAPGDSVAPETVVAVEDALLAAGLLDALVTPSSSTFSFDAGPDVRWLTPGAPVTGPSLATLLRPDPEAPAELAGPVAAWLASVPLDPSDALPVFVSDTGAWGLARMGGVVSTGHTRVARYLGATAREAAWIAAVADAEEAMERAKLARAAAEARHREAEARKQAWTALANEVASHSLLRTLESAILTLAKSSQQAETLNAELTAAAEALAGARAAAAVATTALLDACRAVVTRPFDATDANALVQELRRLRDALTRARGLLIDWEKQDRDAVVAEEQEAEAQERAVDARRASTAATAAAKAAADALMALETQRAADTELLDLVTRLARLRQSLPGLNKACKDAILHEAAAKAKADEAGLQRARAEDAAATTATEAANAWQLCHRTWAAHPGVLPELPPDENGEAPPSAVLQRLAAYAIGDPALKSLESELFALVASLRVGALVAYDPAVDPATMVTRVTAPGTSAHLRLPVEAVSRMLTQQVEDLGNQVSAAERELTEAILQTSTLRALHDAYARANLLISRMNAVLRKLPISRGANGVVLALSLVPGELPRADGAGMSYAPLLTFLQSNPNLREPGTAVDPGLRAVLLGIVERTWQASVGGGTDFKSTLMKELDVRRWFTVLCEQQSRDASGALTGAKVKVTDKIVRSSSGAEQQFYPFLLLLSALEAHLAGARADAPRLVALDECFDGMDADNTDRLATLLASDLKLGWIMTTPGYSGFSPGVPGVTTYHVRRIHDLIFCTTSVWDGDAQVVTESPELAVSKT